MTGVAIGGAASLAWAGLVIQRREWIAIKDMAFRLLGRARPAA
jgi:hypothetical protein